MNKKLYRIKLKGHLGGVCAGLAEYFQIDPVFIRALFLVSFFGAGFGLLLYFILWIVLPNKNPEFEDLGTTSAKVSEDPLDSDKPEKKSKLYFGGALIVVGALLLINQLLPNFPIETFWPVLLIVLGGFFIYESLNKKSK